MKKLLLLLLITSGVWAQNLPQLQFANKQTSIGFGGSISITNSTRDTNNNMYYVGYFYNTADFDPSSNVANLTSIGTYDAFIAKYDAQGNYLWAKKIGGTAGNIINGNITIGGSFLYITGNYTGTVDFDPSNNVANLTSVSDSDIFLARYDLNGFYVLSKSIGGIGAESVANDIKFLNNQIVITGYFKGTVDFDPSAANNYDLISTGNKDYFLAKFSSSLVLQWAINEGGVFEDEGKSLAFDSGGNILVAAKQQSCSTRFDYWFGNVNIANNINGFITSSQVLTQNSTTICNRLRVPNLLNNEPDAADVLFNISFSTPTGTDGSTGTTFINQFVTQKTINGVVYNCYFYATGTYSIITGLVTLNYEYRLFNATTSVFSQNLWTGTITISLQNSMPDNYVLNYSKITYIKKYNNDGVVTWSKNIGALSNINVPNNYNKINLDSANNIFVTGTYSLSSDFDPSTNTNTLTPLGSSGFISKYDTNGNYLWAKNIGTNGTNVVSSCLDPFGNLYVIGSFSDTSIDIDPSAGIFTLNSTDGKNFFSAFDTNGNFIYANPCNAVNNSIVVDSNYDINLSGDFSGYKDLDATANTDYFYSQTTNAFFSKYANYGFSYLFSKQLGNKALGSTTNFVGVDAQHNIYRAGNFGQTIDLDPSANTVNINCVSNSSDIFIAKYNPNGGYIWGKTITGTQAKFITAMNIDPNGNMYIAGYFSGTVDFDPSANTAESTATFNTDTAFYNLFIAKYDSNGNFQWVKNMSGYIFPIKKIVFDANDNFYFQGTYYNDVVDIDPSPSNSIYLTPTGTRDTYFVKYDPQGNLIWAKTINCEDVNSIHFSYRGDFVLQEDYLYLTGWMFGTCDFDPSNSSINNLTAANYGGYFAKYDLNGNYISANVLQDIDGTGISLNYSVTVDSNNNKYLISLFQGTYDFDPSPDSANYVTSTDYESLAISKINQNGSLDWVNTIPLNNENSYIDLNTYSPKIFVNSNDQLVVLANFGGAIDFDSSANDFIVTSSMDIDMNSDTNIVLAKYNTTDGSFVSANKIDGQYNGSMISAVLDTNNDILMSGRFLGTADFDFSSSVQNLTSTSVVYSDTFFAKYNEATLEIVEITGANNSFVIYPNPTNGELFVSHPLYGDFNITITDITGKVLKTTTLQNNESVDVASYPQGMYFIQIESGNERNTYKFIKK